MRIRQAVCLKHFQKNMYKKYNLKPYTRRDQPVLFFGIFQQNIIDVIAQHKSLVLAIWVGSDALYMRNKQYFDYSKILRAPHVKHIAISRCIADDLGACGIPHIYIPITHVIHERFQPVPLGNKVYCYSPKNRSKIYGRDILDKVIQRLPDISFITTNGCDDYASEQMPGIYSECFVGLRPTVHDGQPTTVIELGLMGRRTIHNGDCPGAIHYNGISDIIESIRAEQKKTGMIDYQLAKEVAEFTNIGEDWLDTNFYLGVK